MYEKVLKKIESWLGQMTFKKKILLSTVFVNIVMVGLFSIIGLKLITNRYNALLYKTMASSLSYMGGGVAEKLDELITMSNVFRSDEIVQKRLEVIKREGPGESSEYRVANSELYSVVQKYYNEYQKKNVTYLAVYNEGNNNFATYSYRYLKAEVPEEVEYELVERAAREEGAPVWITDYGQQYGLFLARTIRKIDNLSLENLGTLIVCINLDQIIEEIGNRGEQFENAAWAVYDEHGLISQSGNLTLESADDINEKIAGDYGVVTVGNEEYFGVKGKIPEYDWDYVYLVSYDEIRATQAMVLTLYLLILVVSLFLSSVVLDQVFRKFMHHLDVLIEKMQVFRGQKDLVVSSDYDYSARTDEIGVLHQQFDSMATEINDLIEHNYMNELLMKDAQIKALETQINPHFLYNTLESVNWRAKAIGEKQISLMVESLGRLLRMTLSEKSEVFTLKQEIDIVQYYMTIQQIRFEERLNYHMTIPAGLMHARIPKLTIQPLVENAVKYALEEITDQCQIQISALRHGDQISLFVKNSGSMFEDNILEKLRKKEVEAKGLGIALLNIDKRIKLTFGEEYGVSFYNEEELAVARIEIPYEPVE